MLVQVDAQAQQTSPARFGGHEDLRPGRRWTVPSADPESETTRGPPDLDHANFKLTGHRRKHSDFEVWTFLKLNVGKKS